MGLIDLTQLPAPEVVEALSFESVYAERKAALLELVPETLRDQVETTLQYESEPLAILLQEAAYRELLLQQRVNDAARQVLLAYATGGTLEQLAALFNVERLEITPADPDASPAVEQVLEDDPALRSRTQTAPEGVATAGPINAYIFHAKSASGDVLDVSVATPKFERHAIPADLIARFPAGAFVLSVADDAGLADPMPGDVAISVLSRSGDGTASAELLAVVGSALSAESVRPVTDRPRARSGSILPYTIAAELVCYPGASTAPVLAAAQTAAAAYAEKTHSLGYDVTLSGVYAALHQPGVQRVRLLSPVADIVANAGSAPWCTSIEITVAEGADV